MYKIWGFAWWKSVSSRFAVTPCVVSTIAKLRYRFWKEPNRTTHISTAAKWEIWFRENHGDFTGFFSTFRLACSNLRTCTCTLYKCTCTCARHYRIKAHFSAHQHYEFTPNWLAIYTSLHSVGLCALSTQQVGYVCATNLYYWYYYVHIHCTNTCRCYACCSTYNYLINLTVQPCCVQCLCKPSCQTYSMHDVVRELEIEYTCTCTCTIMYMYMYITCVHTCVLTCTCVLYYVHVCANCA